MDMLARFHRWFAVDAWANRECGRSLRAAGGTSPPGLSTLAHVVGAQWLWLGRLRGEPEPAVVWPRLALEAAVRQVDELERAWCAWLDGASADALAARVTYTNSLGEPWTSVAEDVLVHVLQHSAYHRGQVASALRAAGHEPAYTDFIHCVRRGFVP